MINITNQLTPLLEFLRDNPAFIGSLWLVGILFTAYTAYHNSEFRAAIVEFLKDTMLYTTIFLVGIGASAIVAVYPEVAFNGMMIACVIFAFMVGVHLGISIRDWQHRPTRKRKNDEAQQPIEINLRHLEDGFNEGMAMPFKVIDVVIKRGKV